MQCRAPRASLRHLRHPRFAMGLKACADKYERIVYVLKVLGPLTAQEITFHTSVKQPLIDSMVEDGEIEKTDEIPSRYYLRYGGY